MAKPVLFLYVGAHRLQAAWAPHGGAAAEQLFDDALRWPAGGADSANAEGDSFADLLLACSATPALSRGFVAYVLISNYWVPSASLPWDAQQLRPELAAAVARDQIRDAGHDLGGSDVVRVDDAPFRQPRLAVAYPHELVGRIEDFVGRCNGTLRSISTLAALAWRGVDSPDRKAKEAERVLAILEPGGNGVPTVVLARGQHGSACLDEVVTRPLPASTGGVVRAPEPAIQALVERLGWLPLAAPQSVKEVAMTFAVINLGIENTNLGLPAVLAWWTAPSRRRHGMAVHALDAVARTARPSVFKSLLLCMVIATTALLGWSLWRSEARLRQDRSAETVVRSDVRPPAASTAEELRRIAAVNAAVSELNVPLPRLLRALEAPKDIRVALLGIEVAARSGGGAQAAGAGASRSTLKVHVESPTSLDMTRYVALLAGRKPFVRAYLARHEVPDGARDARGGVAADPRTTYRFTVEVTWED